MVTHTCKPIIRRLRLEDQEFKASLGKVEFKDNREEGREEHYGELEGEEKKGGRGRGGGDSCHLGEYSS